MPRLAAVVERADGEDTGSAAFTLRFRRDAAGRILVEGTVAATLRLRCERCMGLLDLPVQSSFVLAVVAGLDEAARLPEDYEPLLPEDTTVDPAALVEDELLLAVPAVPRHAAGACRPPAFVAAAGDAREDQPSDKENPFAVLEALKRRH